MNLTQEYSRVSSVHDPDDRAWLVSPDGRVFNCGFLHETCVGRLKELRPFLEEGDETVPDLLDKGWGKVGYFNTYAYLQVGSLQDRVLKSYQSILKDLDFYTGGNVEVITTGDTAVFPYKDFRHFGSVMDMRKYMRSGGF